MERLEPILTLYLYKLIMIGVLGVIGAVSRYLFTL